MGVLHDVSSLSIESKLIASGLNRDQIDRAMKNLVGRDWKAVRAAQWLKPERLAKLHAGNHHRPCDRDGGRAR